MKKYALVCLVLLAFFSIAKGQETPVWDTAESMRELGLSAQTALFRSEPDLDQIAVDLQAMSDLYTNALQSNIAAAAPAVDEAIILAISEAQVAGAAGDAPGLALARGQMWAHLLHGSYRVTLSALDDGETETAVEWLRLREYRRSTIVNLVNSPADAVMQQVLRETVSPTDAKLIVDSDLRDTTFFRLREALNELDEAIESQFATRSSEWVGKAQGYFALLEEDYISKQGASASADLWTALDAAGKAAVSEDWATLTTQAEIVRSGLANYQPIAFTEEQLAERAQLLYLYTDLIWIEYRDAVRNGEITIAIEYQETVTFRNQAETIFEELRPTIEANDPSAAQRLAEIYTEIEAIVAVIGPKADVEPLVMEAIGLIETGLAVDATAVADSGASITLINNLLDEVMIAVESGNYELAEDTRIEAYAFFETGPEVKLANRAPRLARTIEGIFWEGTGGEEGLAAMIRNEESPDTIEARIATLRERLAESEAFLAAETNSTVTIFSSAAIIIREGLEAVLIIGAIIGFMRQSAETRKYVWWVGAGVAAAIALSVLIWWGANTIFVISFSNRELLEGLTALVAVAVLFYVTNWLFQKVYVQDWMTFVKEQVGKALTSGSAMGLAFLGFTVVFREGFETVLFYQTLLFDSDPQAVGIGFVGGLVLILIVAYLILQASVRLPLKPFFNVTTALLLIMAFNFMGKGFRGLQEAGYVNATWLSWMPENLLLIELFGIYPTVETTLAQLGFVLLVVGTFGWSLFQSRQKRVNSVATD
ncbi:MAG: FTR1 family protein [Chloroflexota bacterium]